MCTNAECDQINDFTEEIIRNVIARGIADQEIQLDLLGEKNQDVTLKDMIEYIEAKESGKRSASRLLDPQSTDAISSSYRRGKQHDVCNRGRARPTTFITTWGRYRYLWTPQRYYSVRRRLHTTIPRDWCIGDKTKCVDDTLLWSDTIEASYLQDIP